MFWSVRDDVCDVEWTLRAVIIGSPFILMTFQVKDLIGRGDVLSHQHLFTEPFDVKQTFPIKPY